LLQVTPTAGQGVRAVAAANPASTGAGNPIDFTVRLSSPAAQGQTVTWRMTQANCFREANGASAPYNATDPFQFFSFPAGQTSAIIRVIPVNNGGCTDRRAPITHIFEAWVGRFTAECPGHRRDDGPDVHPHDGFAALPVALRSLG
jgi:hypothetical protein